MRSTDSIAQLAPALVKALGMIEGAAQSGENTHLKSKYATLEDVIDATQAILSECELGLIQIPGAITGGMLNLETMILHTSGEYIIGDFQMPVGKGDPQSVGSALTYARRYAQKAGLNIPDLDDDGQGVKEAKPGKHAKITPAPDGADWPQCSGKGTPVAEAKATGLDEKFRAFKTEIEGLLTMVEIGQFRKVRTAEIALMPINWRKALREIADEQIIEINRQAEQEAA